MVVTGLGVVCPAGVGVGPAWANLVAGVSATGPITEDRFSAIPSRVAAYVPRGNSGGQLDLDKHFTQSDRGVENI